GEIRRASHGAAEASDLGGWVGLGALMPNTCRCCTSASRPLSAWSAGIGFWPPKRLFLGDRRASQALDMASNLNQLSTTLRQIAGGRASFGHARHPPGGLKAPAPDARIDDPED